MPSLFAIWEEKIFLSLLILILIFMTASWAEPFRIITTFWLTNLLWTSKRRELRLKEKEVSSLRSSGLPVAWRNWYLSQGVGLKLLTYPLFSILQETMQSFSKCSFFFFFFLWGEEIIERFFFSPLNSSTSTYPAVESCFAMLNYIHIIPLSIFVVCRV